MGDLAKKTLKTAQELFEEFVTKTDDWVYRGQPNDKPLRTTIERKLSAWGIVQSRGQAIEHQVRRDFVRRLLGDEHQHVSKDTLYCFALMQHHGAPTRLLDATYSPYVAARFATADGFLTDEGEPTTPVIWCLNGRWINVAVDSRVKRNGVKQIGFGRLFQGQRAWPGTASYSRGICAASGWR